MRDGEGWRGRVVFEGAWWCSHPGITCFLWSLSEGEGACHRGREVPSQQLAGFWCQPDSVALPSLCLWGYKVPT